VRDRFLRLPAVQEITGRSVASIYRDLQTGTFPQRIALGARCVAWLESEIQAWMGHKIAKSRPALINDGRFDDKPIAIITL